MPHRDPARCYLPVCSLCDAYADGYTAGKAKLESELLDRLDGPPHATGCGCRPCLLVRAVLARPVRLSARWRRFAERLALRDTRPYRVDGS